MPMPPPDLDQTRAPRQWRGRAIGLAVSVVALVIRYALWPRTNPDTDDAFLPWYNYIASHGGIHALRDSFSDYGPPYLYLLTAATYFRAAVPPLAAIKMISIAGDFAAAAAIYRLVRLRYPSGDLPWLAYAAVLFAPTVVLNSAVWGQSDAIYTACLLACVYNACRDRPLATVVWFSLAFAFKLQAVFLGPFMLLLFVERRIPWRYALVGPVVFALTLVPAALAGRPIFDLVTIYLQQANEYHYLSANAPNLYVYISNAHYGPVHRIGIVVAAVAGLTIAFSRFWRRGQRPSLDATNLVQTATLSVAVMPFLLPAMHDRYFYPADLLSIAQAFFVPALAPVAIAFQVTSGWAYRVFLARRYTPLKGLALINAVVILVLVWQYWRRWATTRLSTDPPDGESGAGDRAPPVLPLVG
jgi:Gpi18-like mannosyltransferase